MEPTVGMIVHYYPGKDDPMLSGSGPFAAIVVYADGNTVNLAVFDASGFHTIRTGIEMASAEQRAGRWDWPPLMSFTIKTNSP
jgi:hypothetical protein